MRNKKTEKPFKQGCVHRHVHGHSVKIESVSKDGKTAAISFSVGGQFYHMENQSCKDLKNVLK